MGFWDKKTDTKPEDTKTNTVTRMSGFSGIDEIASAAPSSTGSQAKPLDESRATVKRGRPSAASIPAPAPQAQSDKAKEERKAKAMSIVGEALMREIAVIPYETWAFMASDPLLRLTEAEQKELADAYFLLAQAYDPDFSKPFWLALTITAKNWNLVSKRVKEHSDRVKLAKESNREDNLASMAVS